jgi:Domain of unknown function (DUF4157)
MDADKFVLQQTSKRYMTFQRVQKSTSLNPQKKQTISPFVPRPSVIQTHEVSNAPPTQEEIKYLDLLPDNKDEFGTPKPETVSRFNHDFTKIPLHSPDTPALIQPKFIIGQPGDKYEQEADTMARHVVQRIYAPMANSEMDRSQPKSELVQRMRDNNILQQSDSIERSRMFDHKQGLMKKPPEAQLQRSPLIQCQPSEGAIAATPDVEASIQQLQGSGQPLADSIREQMEQSFAADFSRVKVHTDVQSDKLNSSLQAKAFTTGQDVFFRQGEYNPGSRGGQELLAHELTHVVQQSGGAVQRSSMPLEKGKGRLNFLAPIRNTIQPMIQREIAVQIDVGIADQISDIVLAGTRPTGALDQTKEGSHTTAWIVTVEGVKNAVMGKKVEDAYTSVDKLFKTAQALPGAKRVDNLASHKKQKYNEALEAAKTAKSNAKKHENISSLQMYIRAYLSYRNIIPLSAVDSGSNADGRGEGRMVGIIRNFNDYQPNVVVGAMLALFDATATSNAVDDNFKSNKGDRSANVPGMAKNENADSLKKDIMEQHMMSLQASFPEAFAHAFKGYDKSNLLKFFARAEKTTAKGVLEQANFMDVQEALEDQKDPGSSDAEPEEETFGTGKKTAAIQIELGTGKNIKSIFFGNRPHGLFGSKHGSHTTAWGVFTEGVLIAAKGKPINKAVLSIKALYDSALTLPGVARAQYLTAERKKAFEDAKRDVKETDTNNVTSLSDLQNYILAYLTFRNLVPMSAAMLGRATGKGESEALDKLRNYKSFDASELQESVFKLLDAEALIAIARGSQKLPEKIPGNNLNALYIEDNLKDYAIRKKLITRDEARKREGVKKINYSDSTKSKKKKTATSTAEKPKKSLTEAIAEARNMIAADVQVLDKSIASEKDLKKKAELQTTRNELILKYLKDWYSPESDDQTHQRIPGAEGWGETQQEDLPILGNKKNVEKSSKRAQRLTEVVRQHLMTVKTSFPDAYKNARIDQNVVKAHITFQRPQVVLVDQQGELAEIIDTVTGDDNLLQQCLAP